MAQGLVSRPGHLWSPVMRHPAFDEQRPGNMSTSEMRGGGVHLSSNFHLPDFRFLFDLFHTSVSRLPHRSTPLVRFVSFLTPFSLSLSFPLLTSFCLFLPHIHDLRRSQPRTLRYALALSSTQLSPDHDHGHSLVVRSLLTKTPRTHALPFSHFYILFNL